MCTCKVLHSIQPTISAVLRQKCIASRASPEMRGVVTVLDAQLELAHDAQRMRVGLTAQRRFARLSYVYVSVVYLCVCCISPFSVSDITHRAPLPPPGGRGRVLGQPPQAQPIGALISILVFFPPPCFPASLSCTSRAPLILVIPAPRVPQVVNDLFCGQLKSTLSFKTCGK